MKKNNIEFNIIKEYKNGVRVGNVPRHTNNKKQSGINQSWFPKNGTEEKLNKQDKLFQEVKKNLMVRLKLDIMKM